jgi:uncharacterized protein (DUF342 family)
VGREETNKVKKMKAYEKMTLDELAEARIKLDEQMAKLRQEKKKIQNEVDLRQVAGPSTGHAITHAGGIESSEEVGG